MALQHDTIAVILVCDGCNEAKDSLYAAHTGEIPEVWYCSAECWLKTWAD